MEKVHIPLIVQAAVVLALRSPNLMSFCVDHAIPQFPFKLGMI